VSDAARARNYPRHFDGRRYFNPNAPQVRGFSKVLKWKLTSRTEPSPRFVADVTPSVPPERIDDESLRVTLVNHSTVLLQQSGLNILTDPIWSERASPFTWAGPKRHRAPGVRWEDLPPIDIALISHNHYDHLDLDTLTRLMRRGASTFVVPRGVGELMLARGLQPVRELDWGDSANLSGATVHSVPALHFSSRWLNDRNRTLWCGYLVETPRRRVYFAGDTAFGWHFAAIRERFGSPDCALLPIGAYEPRWFMSRAHMSPEDAVRAHEILEANTSIAIHHATFQLTDEHIDRPRADLRACGPANFLTPANGEFVTLP
jgi:L-ascorbate metabolism protein UlaG (beta-lactamase superfamily)